MMGSVKWFSLSKGYGFIQPDDGSADVYVHISAVERLGAGHLSEGQRIKYDLQEDRKRHRSWAVNLSTE